MTNRKYDKRRINKINIINQNEVKQKWITFIDIAAHFECLDKRLFKKNISYIMNKPQIFQSKHSKHLRWECKKMI